MSTTEMVGTFRQAAEVIRTGGLVQYAYENDTRHCAVGALMMAKGVEMFCVDAVRSEVSYLADLLGRVDDSGVPLYAVTAWNDRADRTADDVATLLEQAAEKLEADL